jgi:hypothetical protein
LTLTFVGELCQTHLLRREGFIQVKEVKHGGRQIPEGRREDLLKATHRRKQILEGWQIGNFLQ